MPPTASDIVYVRVGVTLAGIAAETLIAQVPSSVLPEYVSQYSVPATVVALGAAFASASDGVHEMKVALVKVAIVV